MKKIFQFLLSFSLLFTLMIPVQSIYAKDMQPTPTLTVNYYEDYLSANAPDVLKQFMNLSASDKQVFIDKLQDPSTYEHVKTNVTPLQISSLTARSLSSSFTGTGSVTDSVTILGIKVIEYKCSITFTSTNNSVTKIISTDAYVVRNLNPVVQTSLNSKSSWISGGIAYLNATFNYNLGIKGYSANIGVLSASMGVNGSGTIVKDVWSTS